MSNIIQIKHGWNTPTSTGVLRSYELGFVDSDNRLIIGVDGALPKEIKVNQATSAEQLGGKSADKYATVENLTKKENPLVVTKAGYADNAGYAGNAGNLGGKPASDYASATSVASNTQNIGKINTTLTNTNTTLANTNSTLANTNSNLNRIDTDLNNTKADLKKVEQAIAGLQPAGNYVKTTKLYDNASGSTGTVTLSDSAANFSLLEIIVGYSDKVICGNAKIYQPNSKSVDISASTVGGTKSIGMSRTRCTISGNTITQSNNYKTQISLTDSGTVTWATPTANNLYIYSVIGYK